MQALQEISGPKSKDALNKKVNGACVKVRSTFSLSFPKL